MKRTILLGLTAAIALATLPGCVVQSYKPKELHHIKKANIDYEQTVGNVTLRIKKFTETDCIEQFGSRCKRLMSGPQAVYPLQISITNDSSINLQLSKDDLSVKIVPPSVVASRIKNGVTPVVITALAGLSGAALSCCGLYHSCLNLAGGLMKFAVPYSGAWTTLFFISALGIPTFVIGTPLLIGAQIVENRHVNKKIARDLATKTLNDTLEIPAHTTTSTLIFTRKKHLLDPVLITLRSQSSAENNALNFYVNLKLI
jgi:hypothetical protein